MKLVSHETMRIARVVRRMQGVYQAKALCG